MVTWVGLKQRDYWCWILNACDKMPGLTSVTNTISQVRINFKVEYK